MSKFRLAIDMGGTDIKTGVVDDQFNIIKRHVIPTGPERPFEVVVADMAQGCEKTESQVFRRNRSEEGGEGGFVLVASAPDMQPHAGAGDDLFAVVMVHGGLLAPGDDGRARLAPH